jgi:hypothetical protein
MHEPSLFTGQGDDGTFVPFTDILFNALLGFSMMVFIAFSLIKPDAEANAVNIKAEFIITATRPDFNPDDIDLYVEDPLGQIVWYHQMQKGFMSIDRDDRGNYLDQLTVNGVKTVNPLNQETVSIRRNIPGEYVVNVYKFSDDSGAPTPVSVKVEKINPRVSVVSYRTVTLVAKDDEQTAVRFTIDAEGNVTGTSLRAAGLVRRATK